VSNNNGNTAAAASTTSFPASGIIRTEQTYATFENARKALEKKLALAGETLATARWMIAATAEGRFAPVLVGVPYLPFAHNGITVVG
jgi:hypothetical protein